ncbi:type VI secretion system protein TssR domain-containing protein [Flagellimonas marinaquae]|uniref:type VI secretion system protein TssR domain-containing protein n=1 Tax=Flagellimonas marinaquae TaxID=254955 RepID=UPI002075495E|nr:type VI secretion system protein TssR domain-containing protein [Allomuricauda aquimarina]USD26865.1 hypothetical protein MJO53_08200 [Allomuricauda aquimarina]
MNKQLIHSIMFIFLGLMLIGCAGYGKYSKVDKIGKNTYNLLDKTGCRKQKKNKNLKIVYSDRANNFSYIDQLGLKRGEKQGFLNPYYVIGDDGDFVQVVAYKPTAIGKPKGMFSFLFNGKSTFSDIKKVPYIGWMHKSNLLHYQQPITDPKNLRPIQYMIGFHDLETIYNLKEFINKDTVHVYMDPKLNKKSKIYLKINQMVYLYKYNPSKTAALVSNLDNMSLADSVKRKMGWISSKLIIPIGQRKIHKLNEGSSIKAWGSPDTIADREIVNSIVFERSRGCNTIDSLATEIIAPLYVWNNNDNKLINVKGHDLPLSEIPNIKNDNKKINFHLIFDCGKEQRKKLLLQIASLQRIWLLATKNKMLKDYEFTFSASSYGCGDFYYVDKTVSFSKWLDYLQNVFLGKITPEAVNNDGIIKCFDFITNDAKLPGFENNIVLVIGEDRLSLPNGSNKQIVSTRLHNSIEKLAKSSSKLLFYQMENNIQNKYQDYTLQAKLIVNKVGEEYAEFLKDFTVMNRLVKTKNLYTNIPSDTDNIFIHNPPENSVYSGGIVFPKINKSLSQISFDKALDSLLTRTLRFNKMFIKSLESSAVELGFLRSIPSKRLLKLIDKDDIYLSGISYLPKNQVYEQYYESLFINPKDNSNTNTGYMLTKEELDVLIQNYEAIIPMADNLLDNRKRKHLLKVYRKSVRGLNKLMYQKALKRNATLGNILYMKTGIPVRDTILSTMKIKDVDSKRMFSHEEFTDWMASLRKKINFLENHLNDSYFEPIEDGSNTIYYFINEENLL